MKFFIVFILMFSMHRNAHCSMQLFSDHLLFVHNAASDEQDPPDDLVVDNMPKPISMVNPKYPAIARKENINGMVWLKLLVGEDGLVKRSVLKESSFTRNGEEVNINTATPAVRVALDSISLVCRDAAEQWKFTPAKINDKPVKVWVVLPFKFKLDGTPKKSGVR